MGRETRLTFSAAKIPMLDNVSVLFYSRSSPQMGLPRRGRVAVAAAALWNTVHHVCGIRPSLAGGGGASAGRALRGARPCVRRRVWAGASRALESQEKPMKAKVHLGFSAPDLGFPWLSAVRKAKKSQ